MVARRPLVMGADGFPQVLQPGDTLAPAAGLIYANPTVPAGNTVANTAAESAWTSRATIPAGAVIPGQTVILVRQGGTYGAGLTQTITPRIRLGGVQLVSLAVMGLIAGAGTPWSADAEFVVMADGTVRGGGVLYVADNTTRIIRTPAGIGGFNFTQPLVLTASAQWAMASAANTITCDAFTVRVERF